MAHATPKKFESILGWSLDLMLNERLGLVSACMRSVVVAPIPLLIQMIVDEALHGGNLREIAGAGLLCAGLLLMHYSFAVYGTMRIAASLEDRIAGFRSTIFNRIQFISFGYLDTSATSKLVSKYSFDTQRVHDSLLLIVSQIIPNIIYTLGVLTVLFWINWRLCFLTLFLLPIFYVAHRNFRTSLKERTHEARKAQEELTGKAGELINSIRMVRSLGEDESAKVKIRDDNDATAVTRFRVISIGSRFGTFMYVSSQIVTLMIVGGGAVLVTRDILTAGALVAFVAAIPQILMPVHILTQFTDQFIQGNESYRSVRELLDTKLVENWTGKGRIDNIRGEVELDDIEFRYPSKPDTVILQNFNLHVKAGENVALVGHSGSGKSTLTYLVLGLYEACKGKVRIDGKPMESLDVRWLRRQCAIVMQDNILLSGSITENLRFAKGDATDDEIREAARMAHAEEFIQKLPEGYDTIVGERGAMLSGGQRQRISIARAILRKPAILILDEATSALDNQSERLIQQAMNELSKNRTVITIAHRLDTIRNADRIIVMDRGKIVDQGTYDELCATSEHFQKLLAQNGSEIEEPALTT